MLFARSLAPLHFWDPGTYSYSIKHKHYYCEGLSAIVFLVVKVVLIADNIRSAHNVGSLLRTADGLGVSHVYLAGYTPYPPTADDKRLPHEQARALSQITKTSLGAEKTVDWSHETDIESLLHQLKKQGYSLAGLEQTDKSVSLHQYTVPAKIGLVVGNEIEGVSEAALKLCDAILEIPMRGAKESFNVVVAAAITLYCLCSTN